MNRFKLLRRILSFALAITLLLTTSQSAVASDSVKYSKKYVVKTPSITEISLDQKLYDGMTEAELERKIYESLSPEAKILYDSVDSNGTVKIKKGSLKTPDAQINASAADAYSQLIRDLSALGLPAAVFNSLKAAAASLAAAVADGPLPIGDIIAALTAVTLVVVVAVNWNEVEPVWDSIVNAFKRAFSNSSSNISSAFSSTKTEIGEQTKKTPSITVNGKSVTVNAVRYLCNTRADSIAQKRYSGTTYFVAVRFNNWVWVCMDRPLTATQARIVQLTNNSVAGIWACNESAAINLCQPAIRGPEIHNNGAPGYFYHYHRDLPDTKHCHVWYCKP